MPPTPRTAVLASAAVAAVVGGFLMQPRGPAEVRLPAVAVKAVGTPLPPGRPVGNAGCLAAACHGGPASDTLTGKLDANAWQSSGTCWNAADPHTRAYSLLTDNPNRPVRVTAREIMSRMHSPFPATEDARCLACHSNPSLPLFDQARHLRSADAAVENEWEVDGRLQAFQREGVGCESCHGNASGWIREHTTWTGDRREVYTKTGMTPLFDIGERAMTCLGCHVGAPADPTRGYAVRDMNHDMIAAGHPRLNFDFGEFHRVLPKHWQEKDRTPIGPKPRGKRFEGELWAVGRVAHAEAACKLLADRADRAAAGDPRTPWPELAEYNCASCHHDLRPGRSGEGTRGTRPLGALRWQTIWPLNGEAANAVVQPVVTVMQKKRPAGFGEVGPVARESAVKLAEMRQRFTTASDGNVKTFFYSVRSRELTDTEWDIASQTLWALSAASRAGLLNGKPAADFERAYDAFRRGDWDSARHTRAKFLIHPYP